MPRKSSKWNWRKFLTPREAKYIARADEARAKWTELNKERTTIVNRAMKRAYYEKLKKER